MIPPIVFLLSTTLQLTAAVYAFRLAGAPKQKTAWMLIALALLLMAGRRVMIFVSLVLAGAEIPFDAPEIVALAVSGLMLAGVIRMGSYFQSVVSTEEAMRKKEEVLSAGQRIAHLGSWEWNVEKDGIVWSEEIYRIFGLSRDQFDGTYEGFLARVHAEDREFVRNEVSAALHEGKPFSIDYRIVRPDKAQRRIFAQGEVTHGANGKPARMAGTVLDITERRQAEEALGALARQQRAAAELGRAALRGMDLPSLMNEAVSLSARTLDVEYTKVLEFLPADDSFRLVAGVGWKPGLVGHSRIPSGKDSQAGYTLLSDEPVIVEDLRMESRFSGPPLLHDHGVISGMSIIIGGEDDPFGVFGVHTRRHRIFTEDDVHFLETVANILADAIRQQRTQYLLREGEENFRMLVENAYDGILLAGSQGTHLFANRRAAEITGYSTDELLKVTIKDLAHPDELPKIMERFVMRMAKQDVPRQYETLIRRKNGETLPIEITASRSTWKGQPAVIVVFRDIAERLRLEEERLKTSKLESLGTLAGGIAHDFNNILTGVLANVSLANRPRSRGRKGPPSSRPSRKSHAEGKGPHAPAPHVRQGRGPRQEGVSGRGPPGRLGDLRPPRIEHEGRDRSREQSLGGRGGRRTDQPGDPEHRHQRGPGNAERRNRPRPRVERADRQWDRPSPQARTIRAPLRHRRGDRDPAGASSADLRPVLHDETERKRLGAGHGLLDRPEPRGGRQCRIGTRRRHDDRDLSPGLGRAAPRDSLFRRDTAQGKRANPGHGRRRGGP